jgi:transposase InsO family protein
VVDRGLSKGVILCSCAKTITWEGTATLLHDNLFKRFGLPDKIISDRDLRFAAHAFQELPKLLKIKSNLTTAYHPQSDGATERVNQEIKAYLSIIAHHTQKTGYISLALWNSHTTIEDMLNEFIPHLN